MHQKAEIENASLFKAIVACVVALLATLLPNMLKAQRIVIDDFPVVVKPYSVAVQTEALTVTGISDPAGHSCCVTEPPDYVEFFTDEDGYLVLRESGDEDEVPWFDFGPIALDGSQEISAESIATVAGYSNIRTELTASFGYDSIRGQIEIGADGGLPSGKPIIFDILIDAIDRLDFVEPQTAFLAVHAEAGVGTSLIPVGLEEEKPQDMYLMMQDELQATAADWWLVLLAGGEFLSFDLTSGTFVPGLRPTYQGPTADALQPVRFWTLTEQPFDEVVLFFGVDTDQDGIVNESSLIGTGYTFYFN